MKKNRDGRQMMKTQMIILAGGSGERFGGNIPKQFVKIAGKTIIEHTIAQIERSDEIDSMIIVVHEKFYDYMNDLILANHFSKVKKVIVGGASRQESSYAGICACDEDTEN
ncbi:MAG: 2-C-methyl-D-erythritol 4-phosphate cytidylyltransferase, partial [Lachnospiraceae bacterium]|nr:2-C-methyl-D-erythritol 4-phosphate cytidylyltransferase [Lachnospiraceae bacterium]